MKTPPKEITVIAAVIEQRGSFLVTRRPPDVHLGGYWEFPGGKCEPQETDAQCLRREIREELATDIKISKEILRTVHAYEDLTVELRFYRCTLTGTPKPVFQQEMRWVPRLELQSLQFPEADEELIRKLTKLANQSHTVVR